MAEQINVRITAEAYFQRPVYAEHDLIQLIDGEVIIDMPPTHHHRAAATSHHKIMSELVFAVSRRVG